MKFSVLTILICFSAPLLSAQSDSIAMPIPSHGQYIQATDCTTEINQKDGNADGAAAVNLKKEHTEIRPAKAQKPKPDKTINPEYPGGAVAMRKYVADNFKYPIEARDANTQGTVYVGFVIEADGSITCINVLRGLNGPGARLCNAEAKRLIANMPHWKPGTVNGIPTRVQMNVPVTFKLM